MSRSKLVSIDRHEIQKRLREVKLTQKELADDIDMNYQALSRALSIGKISDKLHQRIMQRLYPEPADGLEHLLDLLDECRAIIMSKVSTQ